MASPRLAAAAALLCLAALPATVRAQPRGGAPSISVGRISTERTCNLYEESAGRTAVAASAYGYAASASWRTWLVRDCVDNFASLRTSLEAALAGSGKLSVRPSGGAYVVTGRISDIGGEGGAPPASGPQRNSDYAISSSSMFVNMDVTVRDAAGRIVFGQLLTKKIETGSDISTGGFRTTTSSSGQGLYTKLQHEVALAVARQVSFRLVPLKVVGGDGRTIQLNYGSPLLTLGTMIQATSPDGGAVARYNVTSATGATATAELEGDGETARIIPGSTAVVLEPDDPASNGRRFKRVELPG